jgi:CrcB protein
VSGLLGAPWVLWLAVAVGSALGGVARFAVGLLATRLATGHAMPSAVSGGVLNTVGGGVAAVAAPPAWPWGTFAVNVVGSLVIGLLAGWWAGRGQPPLPRALLMVGVLGGFTTYSSFALETVQLWSAGAAPRALAYVLATTLLCVLAAAAGLWLWQQFGSQGAAR